jgi:DNA polymerase
MIGKRLADFSAIELAAYEAYCRNDTDGCRAIFDIMVEGYPVAELKIIDMVVRMFTEPELELDEPGLRDYHLTLQAQKNELLIDAGVTLDEVMSNEKFAAALRRVGINPPMKRSQTTGQMTYAFAKTDEVFRDLEEHPDDQVQALMAARFGNRSTLNETRTLRMADMATRGSACVYLKYSGAQQTHRLSGGDSTNWQNNQRGGVIRNCIVAPEGHLLVVADLKNIESRVVDTLAGQGDAIQSYRDYDAGFGPDIYCVMASKLYRRDITPEDVEERRLGKHVKLSCGFQSGAERFQETARIIGKLKLDMGTCEAAVNIYRQSHPFVVMLWNRGQSAIGSLAGGPDGEKYLDPSRLVQIEQGALLLPNGLRIRYPELSCSDREWTFKSNRGERTKLYGGKIIENVVQALARNVGLEQTLKIHRHAPCKLSVHDEGVFLVREDRAEEVAAVAKEVMSTSPTWWPDLPVAVDVKIVRVYGEAK